MARFALSCALLALMAITATALELEAPWTGSRGLLGCNKARISTCSYSGGCGSSGVYRVRINGLPSCCKSGTITGTLSGLSVSYTASNGVCRNNGGKTPSPHDFSGTYGPFSVGSATFTMDGKGNAYGYVCIKAIDSDCSNVSGASVVDIRNRVDDCPNGLRPEVDSETCTVNWGTLSITSSTGCAGATIPTKSFRINGSC